MDFGTLLHTAQKNKKGTKNEPVRCYSTKFEPPKKEQRNKQQLSDNIKKFLAKKEEEERQKKLEAHKRKEDLLALRAKDKKATRCMNVMVKRTKSANQSVLQDAVDVNNTSVTLAGPIQPDEDDYGYVSQEAAAYYNKMMEKYSKLPDEPKFNLKKKKVSTDLNSTKERVKAAIEREREEANMPHRRKRKHRDEEIEDVASPHQEQQVFKKPRPVAPPPLNFNDLLKLAEKKQFEPVVIEQKPKEEEKLFTKKQKKEMEREKEWRERKEGKLPPLVSNSTTDGKNQKIPQITQKANESKASTSSKPNVVDIPRKSQELRFPESNKKVTVNRTPTLSDRKPNVPSSDIQSASSSKPNSLNKARDLNDLKRDNNKLKGRELQPPRKAPPKLSDVRQKQVAPTDVRTKQFPPTDVRPKQFPPSDVKPKQFPPRDLQPKRFPPPDVRRREFPPTKDVKRKPLVNKRRILDDDEEYDSEMDDFIDDGPADGEDYSKYISEIFGYDKSKYRQLDEDVDNMESTFAQQMREEVISTKIGIMEDLEDMRLEEEQKRRKALMKKRM